jgi:putative transposase
VREVFDARVTARCQLHKTRNVRDRLPERLRIRGERRIRQAYHAESALEAEVQVTTVAGELGKAHPRPAASLREGLDKTLTVLRLGAPPTLARTQRGGRRSTESGTASR